MPGYLKQLDSVLIKPAGPDCNLACRYCFYLDHARLFPEAAPHRMDEAVLAATVRQVLGAGSPQVSFGWQGGEPTLMGLPFFERAVELEKQHGRGGQTIGNGLQTNGLLIDESWCRFLREHQFLVGLSLDGPEPVHDRYRLARSGQPTWGRVMDAAKRMLDGGVEVNALAVVTDRSAECPREVYEFLRDTGLRYMQFIPCLEPEPRPAVGPSEFAAGPERLGRFLCTVFDAWRADFRDGRPTTSIRWFDSVFATYIGVQAMECTLLPECGCYVVVEHNGDVFACDFFVEEEWKLGNVQAGTLADMLNSPQQARFGRRKAELAAACQACPWLPHCRGGCPKERTGQRSRFCDAYRMFFAHADSFFRELAAEKSQKVDKSKGQKVDEGHESDDIHGDGVSNVRGTERARALARFAMLDARGRGAARNAPCPCGSGMKYKRCCGR